MDGISPQKMKRAAIIMICIGVFFIFGFLDDADKWSVFCSDPVTVQAVVTGNEESYNYRGRKRCGNMYSYEPYVRYEVYGKEYNTKLDSDMPRYSPAPVGSQMSLTVDGKKPVKILKKPGVRTLIFSALSFFCMVFGVLIFRAYKMQSDAG